MSPSSWLFSSIWSRTPAQASRCARRTGSVARAQAGRSAGRNEPARTDVVPRRTPRRTAWLPPVLAKWQTEYPRVELRINLEATRQPVPALLAGALDLALTTDAPRHARLSRAALFTDVLLLLVPASHPLARRRYATAQDLAREHLLVYDAPREQLDVFTRVLWPQGVEPRRVSRVPLTEALIELVRGGAGVTPLASWVLPARRQGLATVRLTPAGIERRWSAVTLAAGRPSPPLKRFVELLRDRVPAGAAAARRSAS